MERKAIVKAIVCKIDKICNRIRCRLEIERNHDFAFVSFNDCIDCLDTGIILVEHLSLSESKTEKAKYKGCYKGNKN